MRTFFFASILLLCCTAQALAEEIPLPDPGFKIVAPLPEDRPIRARAGQYAGAIYDTHVHLFHQGGTVRPEEIGAEAAKAGVERVVLLPTPNDGIMKDRGQNTAARDRLARKHPDQFKQLCGSEEFTTWMNKAYAEGYDQGDLEHRLEALARRIDAGECAGIGEIGPYHFDKKDGQKTIHFPMNFEPMLRLAGLAAAKGVPLDMHAEPRTRDGKNFEREVFGGIELLYREHPDLVLILSHTGMTSAANLRAMLLRYPRMMTNIKAVSDGKALHWSHLGPVVNPDGELYEDWAALFEEMPERLMVGTDARFGEAQYTSGRYAGRDIKRIRLLLGSLTPYAAECIASANAHQVFGTGE
ncbi:MAG: TatD family hydrolase [Proteobacteria bacterium]|nr:TatD family hydrolase [Pseudomonadota bacterium]